METIWILIILYSGQHTNYIEFKSKDTCQKAMNLVQEATKSNGWYRREAYCVEK